MEWQIYYIIKEWVIVSYSNDFETGTNRYQVLSVDIEA
jgi:hypothetical protein